MTDPSLLLAKLAAALQTNTALMALVGGRDNVVTYAHSYPTSVDLYGAIRTMTPPQILLAWTGTQCADRINGIEHQFAVYLHPTGSVAAMFTALREGTVTSEVGTGKLKLVQLTAMTHPPDVRGCFPRSIVIGDAIFEYFEVPIRITDRGVDN